MKRIMNQVDDIIIDLMEEVTDPQMAADLFIKLTADFLPTNKEFIKLVLWRGLSIETEDSQMTIADDLRDAAGDMEIYFKLDDQITIESATAILDLTQLHQQDLVETYRK